MKLILHRLKLGLLFLGLFECLDLLGELLLECLDFRALVGHLPIDLLTGAGQCHTQRFELFAFSRQLDLPFSQFLGRNGQRGSLPVEFGALLVMPSGPLALLLLEYLLPFLQLGTQLLGVGSLPVEFGALLLMHYGPFALLLREYLLLVLECLLLVLQLAAQLLGFRLLLGQLVARLLLLVVDSGLQAFEFCAAGRDPFARKPGG